jgi:sulfur transfer complex TusBCD TusB component (DsrH family)
MVALYVLFSSTADERAARLAQQRALNTSQVSQCLQSLDSGPSIRAITASLEETAKNAIITTEDLIARAPTGEIADIRRASLARLRESLVSIREFDDRTVETTPTLQECRNLAARLNVDIAKLRKGRS